MKINIQSPTRIDLAGGTLDCWPLYNLVDGAETTNIAIPIFSQVELEPLSGDAPIEIDIADLDFKKSFADLEELLSSPAPELLLVQRVIRYFSPATSFRLKTQSQSPVGAGLGGSSSLCISLIRAFLKLQERTLSTLEMVTLAHNIEAQVLKKPTGTQDYVPAIEPGLNVIHYGVEGPRIEHVKVDLTVPLSRMVLVYTGQPHHSGLNNWQVIKAAMEGDQETLSALHQLKNIAEATASICREETWSDLAEAFQEEFLARVRLSQGFTSPRIDQLKALVAPLGGITKICGAGGGGCVLIWCKTGSRQQVEELCQKSGYQVLDIARPLSPLNS